MDRLHRNPYIAVMAIPGSAGRLDRIPGKSIQQLFLERRRVTSWREAEQLLLALGYNAAHVRIALRFYQSELAAEFSGGRHRDAVQELLGIDYSRLVQKTTLPAGSLLLTYCKTRPVQGGISTADRWVKNGVMFGVGKFLTQPGTAPSRLGIHTTNRHHAKLRLNKPVVVLQSRASGIVDAWTDDVGNGRCIPHMAGGGGIQYRLPRAWLNPQDVQLL